MSMFITPIQPMNPVGTLEESKAAKPAGSGAPFSQVFADAYQNLRDTQAQADADSYALAMGTTDDMTGIMINMQKAEIARTFATQLTTRAVSAYKEIMQMQV